MALFARALACAVIISGLSEAWRWDEYDVGPQQNRHFSGGIRDRISHVCGKGVVYGGLVEVAKKAAGESKIEGKKIEKSRDCRCSGEGGHAEKNRIALLSPVGKDCFDF